MALREVGALAIPEHVLAPAMGFGTPAYHARMLHDEARVMAYIDAIRATVRPGDVVIDLGTGTGVLAVAAARAGARHVFAIEESTIADVAEEVFALNGVADRVTLMRGHSTNLSMPEPATVLVTETLGVDPLDEGLLGALEDVRRRMLAPDARLIPHRISIVAQLVDASATTLARLGTDDLERWKSLYGIDLSPLLDASWEDTTSLTGPPRSLEVPRKSPVCVVEEIDLNVDVTPLAHQQVVLTADGDVGRVAVALGYTVHLAPGIALEVGTHGTPDSHWGWRVFGPLEPRSARTGDVVNARYWRDRTTTKLDFVGHRSET